MSRAKWKGPFVSNELTTSRSQKEIFTKSRSSSIDPLLIGKPVNIHNGKTYVKIVITENMVGKKLGEFAPTRKKFSFKKKKVK